MNPKSPTPNPDLTVRDFDFHLPEELIAQQPPAQRGSSRMLVVRRKSAGVETHSTTTRHSPLTANSFTDLHFQDFPSLLNPGDLLVLNDSRVIPARLYAYKSESSSNARGKQPPTGQIEVLLTVPDAAGNWSALVRPGRKVRPGDILEFFPKEPPLITGSETAETEAAMDGTQAATDGKARTEGAGAFRPLNQPQEEKRGFSPGNPIGDLAQEGFVTGHDFSRADQANPTHGALAPAKPILRAHILASGQFGERTLRFEPVEDFYGALEEIGHIPLPPYIKRDDAQTDRERYQTVFAHDRGSVAAPTAGLHFTPEILAEIAARGVEIAKITLHVGLGTFAPLRVEKLSEIQLHRERYTLPAETTQALNRARAENRRIVAVGTTTVRTLEHVARESQGHELQPHTGETQIFIQPGHQFQLVDAMLTNFHLPQSSLLMLVSAFAGRERVLAAYHHAIQQKYRFFSYGDCMFLH